jgi:hypothetical protein
MSADTETTPLINSERTIKENEEIQESQSVFSRSKLSLEIHSFLA